MCTGTHVPVHKSRRWGQPQCEKVMTTVVLGAQSIGYPLVRCMSGGTVVH